LKEHYVSITIELYIPNNTSNGKSRGKNM
jgi:hypothetical protein